MKITIGLTRTDRDADYVPAMDGYRPDAPQDVVVLEVAAELSAYSGEEGWETIEAGEAYFTATNAPREVIERHRLALAVYRELAEEMRRQGGVKHRLSMSVGDTIQVDDGDLYEVKPFGWEKVST